MYIVLDSDDPNPKPTLPSILSRSSMLYNPYYLMLKKNEVKLISSCSRLINLNIT